MLISGPHSLRKQKKSQFYNKKKITLFKD